MGRGYGGMRSTLQFFQLPDLVMYSLETVERRRPPGQIASSPLRTERVQVGFQHQEAWSSRGLWRDC